MARPETKAEKVSPRKLQETIDVHAKYGIVILDLFEVPLGGDVYLKRLKLQ